MITIVGVGHVFRLDEQLRRIITERRPDVVCLELDATRYEALRSGDRGSDGNPVFRLFAMFQKRIAGEYGTEVGSEMLAAADAAQEVGARVALIDRHVEETLREFWSRMSFKEKVAVMVGAVGALLFANRKVVEKEMRRLEEQPDYVERIAGDFPVLKEVLIDSRNTHMGAAVSRLAEKHPRIVVVVGDGHVPGLAQILAGKSLPTEIVRLKELRSVTGPEEEGRSPSNASVSVRMDLRRDRNGSEPPGRNP
jgi:pheromone shutdown protein TraB